jgi:DNA polymerase III delta prime subunit
MNRVQKRLLPVLTLILISATLLVACAPASQPARHDTAVPMPATMNMPAATSAALIPATGGTDPLVFRQAVRKLWEDHITWTRAYIISAVAGLPEADAAAQRLLQNQVDIGNAIKPFYGDAAGEQLTSLLKEHITIAVEILSAAKSGDNAAFQDAKKRWYDNADQIAAFLNKANPTDWPLNDMKSMMKSHLDLTLEEATARLKGDWAGDVVAYGKVTDEILGMSDMLAAGIIHQFPGSFAAQTASQSRVDLTLAMDKLWEDHVQWTRFYIMSATAGLPDASAAAGRLLQNQVDIGDAIKPLYGAAAGDQLTALLKTHITIAVDLLSAAKSGDTAAFEKARKDWYRNADEIAVFLHKANPDHWALADMKSMMKEHLDLTLAEATARLKSNWPADVAAYDQVHDEILQMAGMLTEGILAQFPDQFK